MNMALKLMSPTLQFMERVPTALKSHDRCLY
jgi:hypothetical protein